MGVLKGFIWVLILGICTLCSCTSDTSSVTDWIGAIGSIVGLILSSIAVYLAYKAFNQAETTAKNSLRPILSIDFSAEIGKGIYIEVENAGTGPAIISKIQYYYLNEEISEIQAHLIKTLPETSIYQINAIDDVPKIVKAGSTIRLIEVFIADNRLQGVIEKLRSEILLSIANYNIKVEYESIYGDKYSF